MKTTRTQYLALVATFALPVGASAGVIFDNGPALENGSSATSDLDAISTGGIYQDVADDFVLTSAQTLKEIRWSGAYTPSNQAGAVPDDFTIRILDDLFATVASFNVGAVARVDTGLDNLFGLDIYNYESAISPLDLAAGSYWLSIVNNTVGDAEGQRWSWAATDGRVGANARFRQSVGTPLTNADPWVNEASIDVAFSIVAVPEPGTLALLGFGLLGMGAARRRKTG